MGWVSTAIADQVSTAVTSAWIVPFARAIPSARSRALVMLWPRLPGWRRRPRFRARPCSGTSASRRTAARPRCDACGDSLQASALAHIDALLDLDDEASLDRLD